MHPLLQRLDSIAGRLAVDPDALALLALGSVGRDTDRLDEHSDLDFFVVTTDKQRLLEDLSWLGEPLQWCHRNTPDGFQALVQSIFHEFAVFEIDELASIPFEPGRLVWAKNGFDPALVRPPARPSASRKWLVDEALANVYVGLHRFLRGERLSAVRKVQVDALDAVLRLWGDDDPFAPARRAESRVQLPWHTVAGGYDAVPQAARAILACLPTGPDPMRTEVERLLEQAEQLNSAD